MRHRDEWPGGPSSTFVDENGCRWRSSDDFREFLAERIIAPMIASADSDPVPPVPDATLIKESMVRRVERLEWSGQPIIFKRYFVRSAADRAKYLVRRSRAAAEWRAATRLRRLGISTARPLAFGERRRGPFLETAYYACILIENAAALGPWLESRHRPGDGQGAMKLAVLEVVLKQLAILHAAGWRHADFHGGNILVVATGAEVQRIYLIDLHSLRRGLLGGEAGAIGDLTDLLFSLRFVLDHDEMRAAGRVYRTLRGWAATGEPAFWTKIERALERREAIHYRSRARRCIKESSVFTSSWPDLRGGADIPPALHAPRQVWRRRDCDADRILAGVAAHHREIERTGPGVIALARRARLTRVTMRTDGGGPGSMVVKEFLDESRCPGRWRSRRSWRGAHELLVRGVPTPRPHALLVGRDRTGYLLTDDGGPAVPLDFVLYRLARENRLGRPLHKLAAALAEMLGTLWARGLVHRDLSAKNLLVDEDQASFRVLLVDTGDVRRCRRLRRKDVIRALVQLGDLPDFVSEHVKRRFLARLARLARRRDLLDPELLRRVRQGIDQRVRAAGTTVRRGGQDRGAAI